RSVAVSVAAPITWMLLIEQLASMVPMLEAITPWLPFNASHMLLAQALGEAPAGMSVWPPAVPLLVPVLGLAGAGLCAHVRWDSGRWAGMRAASAAQGGTWRRRGGAGARRRTTNGR